MWSSRCCHRLWMKVTTLYGLLTFWDIEIKLDHTCSDINTLRKNLGRVSQASKIHLQRGPKLTNGLESFSIWQSQSNIYPRMWELTHTTKCGGPYKLQGNATWLVPMNLVFVNIGHCRYLSPMPSIVKKFRNMYSLESRPKCTRIKYHYIR